MKTIRSTRLKRAKVTQKGMTIVEILTASSILITLSMGVATFIPAGFKSNDNNRKHIVSNQLFNQVMEEVNSVDFDAVNAGGIDSEPKIHSETETATVFDTSKLAVTLADSDGNKKVLGNTISIGSGEQALTYPRYARINNVDYRIDVKVVKGRYNALMATRPFERSQHLEDLQNLLMPAAMAAQSGSASIQVTATEGYKNTTQFGFNVDCDHCPPANRRVYNWNFGIGEGAGSADSAPSHTFNQAGEKQVYLTISDSKDPNTVISAQTTINIKDSQVLMNVSDNSPEVGQSISFSASCPTSDGNDCGENPEFNWTFGDGSTATGAEVSHVYNEIGSYTPTVTVTGGSHPTASLPLSVSAQNGKESTLEVGPQSIGVAGPAESQETTTFKITAKSSGYNNIGATGVRYVVNFGDGSDPVEIIDDTPDDDNFPVVEHQYTQGGNYTVTLESNPLGLPEGSEHAVASSTSTSISAQSMLELNADAIRVSVNQSVGFSTTSQGLGENPQYEWDFGDGTTSSNYAGFENHAFAQPGTYTVSVRSPNGTQPSASKQIEVLPSLLGSSSNQQSDMKKVFVYVSLWKNSAIDEQDVISTGVFMKGDNR